jgi:hypothetical protein
MKSTLLLILAVNCSALADPLTLEDVSPHLSTNAEIIWKAPITNLPMSLRVYKRTTPRIFSAATISNAVILASLQSKEFPLSSTNEFFLDFDTCPCGHARTFEVSPKSARVSFASPSFRNGSPEDIPSEELLLQRAQDCAVLLGLDPTQMAQKRITTNFCQYDLKGRLATNNSCGRGITLSRRIDGIAFYGDDLVEGFFIELGSHAQIRFFSVIWSDFEPFEVRQIARPDQIIACIRAFKTPVPPEHDEPDYFGRLKILAKATRFIITKITPYYSEYGYGEIPKDNEPSKFVTPVAELDVVAELEHTNVNFRLVSPILAVDAARFSFTK